MKRVLVLSAVLAALSGPRALAFCGFYVAKADTKLFNQASQVALVRDGDTTVLTMANDFQGDPKEFALVVPVPTFIERRQIEVVDKALLDHLDAYTAPRLVEYFDEDPCRPPYLEESVMVRAAPAGAAERKDRGVTVEATYTVGEYDILILSAKESTGLETWLLENGYKIPAGASTVLEGYIKQQMRFFVAKVNLKEQARLGFTFLRPLQVSYASPKFMLPIRLGTVNAKGPQDLFVFALSPQGRVETTNYRTVKLPTGMEVPLFVKAEFKAFYKAMFAEQVRREDMRVVFLEYAWDMASCDPCAAVTAPRALRRPALSGRPRLPGDHRPGELPGAIRAPPPLDRRGPVRGCSRLWARPGLAPGAGGPEPGPAHGLVDRRDPAKGRGADQDQLRGRGPSPCPLVREAVGGPRPRLTTPQSLRRTNSSKVVTPSRTRCRQRSRMVVMPAAAASASSSEAESPQATAPRTSGVPGRTSKIARRPR